MAAILHEEIKILNSLTPQLSRLGETKYTECFQFEILVPILDFFKRLNVANLTPIGT